MRLASAVRCVLGVALLALCAAAPAQPREAPMTPQEARRAGQAGDAAVLARLIRAADPALVRHFDAGFLSPRVEVLPADIEALVVAHFEDPKVGAALRQHTPKYRTRALFERHLARIRATTDAGERSFDQILKTDLEGIEDELLRKASAWPEMPGGGTRLGYFLAKRRHPGAVPLLLASLDGSLQHEHAARWINRPLAALLEYPDREVWQRAADELHRLVSERRIRGDVYLHVKAQLDQTLGQPDLAMARLRGAEARAEYDRRRAALAAMEGASPDPGIGGARRYAAARAEYLARVDALAREIGADTVKYHVAGDWFDLGVFVRFRMGDAQAALPYLRKSAEYRHAFGQFALADTLQLALGDREGALAAYRMALAEASRPTEGMPPPRPYASTGNPMNAFWREWLAAEAEFVRSGKGFRGRVSEAAIGGFFQVVLVHRTMFGATFDAWLAPEARAVPADLRALPASRLALIRAFPAMSELPAEEILRFLARHDPSGFWTACVMAATRFYGDRGPAGRDEADRAGLTELFPAMFAEGRASAMQVAAARFMKSRGLRHVQAARQ